MASSCIFGLKERHVVLPRDVSLSQKFRKVVGARGYTPDSVGKQYNAPPDPYTVLSRPPSWWGPWSTTRRRLGVVDWLQTASLGKISRLGHNVIV